MPKVEIKVIKLAEVHEITLLINNEEISSEYIGGEPEDNNIYRDYKWVVPMLKELAIKLGADVLVTNEIASHKD